MHIKYMEDIKNKILLPKQIKNSHENIPFRSILNIGAWKKEVEVEFVDDLQQDTIGISEDLIGNAKIPEALPYEIRIKDRNIFIGPVIAFFVVPDKEILKTEILNKFKNYYNHYEQLNGLIYICATNGINAKRKTISGYYYNPYSDSEECVWQEGVFPYPGAVYRKTGIPKTVYNDLVEVLGDKIFNSYFFNKWEMWKFLSSYSKLREHLPHTEKLKEITSLDNMLNLYEEVYLKRIEGYKAKGILKVKKSLKDYHFIYRLKGKKIFNNQKEASYFLKEINLNNDYIIQQAITVKEYENRKYDFRVILQKDKTKHWTCSGIIARFGKKNSIATNFLLSGYALPGKEALKKVFNMNEREAFIKEQEIINICIEYGETLDKCVGNYGDLGIDVIVDSDKKVWILEINKLHDHKFPIYSIEDREMYYKVVTTPLEYAKALAGF